MVDPFAPTAAGLAVAAVLGLLLLLGLRLSGFRLLEVAAVLLLAPILALVNLPLWPVERGWIGINAGGALLPIFLTLRFLLHRRVGAARLLLVTAAATGTAYGFSQVLPGGSVQILLLPVVAVTVVAGAVLSRRWDEMGPLTYGGGTLGVLAGADLLRIEQVIHELDQGAAVIGGAGTKDAIYVVGVVAVLLQVGVVLTGWTLERLKR